MGYAVAAGHPLAVDEADRALRKGANAVEAALVAAFVQGVVDPAKCGIGGWGVATVAAPGGAVTVIDFPARAGSRASPAMWRDIVTRPAYHGYLPVLKGNVNDVGYGAIGVPSAVAGYAELHARYGRHWSWPDLIEPAIRYARDGVPVYGGVLGAGAPEWDWPGAVPFAARLATTAAGRRRYLRGERTFLVGEVLRQPELARTLEALAAGGPAAFYHGSIADRMAKDMARHGGLVTAADLAACRPTVTAPLVGRFGAWTVSGPPPPESGVSLLQILSMLDDARSIAPADHSAAATPAGSPRPWSSPRGSALAISPTPPSSRCPSRRCWPRPPLAPPAAAAARQASSRSGIRRAWSSPTSAAW